MPYILILEPLSGCKVPLILHEYIPKVVLGLLTDCGTPLVHQMPNQIGTFCDLYTCPP